VERLFRVVLVVVIASSLAVGLLATGAVLGNADSVQGALHRLTSLERPAASVRNVTFPLQKEVVSALQDNFYRPADLQDLEEGAIRGLLRGTEDEYTTYFSPDEYASFKEHSGGFYSGVGMSVELKNELVTVITVFRGSPAEEGGIRAGNIIYAVDGENVAGLPLEEVVGRIKGEEGTQVELQVYAPPADSPPPQALPGDPAHFPEDSLKTLTLTRQEIQVPVIETERLSVDGQTVAHVQLLGFSEDSARRLREEVRRAVEDEEVAAFILDLRGNGGGLLNEAVSVASIFMEDGVVVTTEGLHSPEEEYRARGSAFDEVPLYVLIDRFSASASEIVAGALQDTERATIVGETSFGKGLVQQIVPLSNGGALKVTTAVYLTPSGRNINDKGVDPQIEAPDDPATDVDETLDRALELIAER
jgi:carboxyl-terminal processing protease